MNNPFFNDGNIPYGTRVLTVNTGSGTLAIVCENINVRRPSTLAKRHGALNQPTGSVAVGDFDEFTCLMQMPGTFSGGTNEPARGWVANVVFDAVADADSSIWYIHEVGRVEVQNDIMKVNVSFIKTYN